MGTSTLRSEREELNNGHNTGTVQHLHKKLKQSRINNIQWSRLTGTSYCEQTKATWQYTFLLWERNSGACPDLFSCRNHVKERGEMSTGLKGLGRTRTDVRDLLRHGETLEGRRVLVSARVSALSRFSSSLFSKSSISLYACVHQFRIKSVNYMLYTNDSKLKKDTLASKCNKTIAIYTNIRHMHLKTH